MKKRNKILALILAGAMTLSLAACSKAVSETEDAGNTEAVVEESTEETTEETETATGSNTPLVIASDDFSEKFSNFFAASVPDQNVADLTGVALLGNDRAGEMIYNGIEGETKTWNGTDYYYQGIADCVVTENEDGTVDYDFTLRDDVLFSDGEKLTADDVIFSYYVYADPSYDGGVSLYSLPIVGMEAYRSGSDTLFNLLVAAGADNTDFTYFTEEQQKTFYETDLPAAGEAFAQSIADYCIANGYVLDETADFDIANGMANWGFATVNEDGSLTTAVTETQYTLQGDDVPTAADFWNEMLVAYDNDIVTLSDTEAAESSVADFLSDDYKNAIVTGDSVNTIEGIQKTGDYSVKVTLDGVSAPAIYQLSIPVQPLHYYGDVAKYDYENGKFGFDKGDLSSVRAKTTKPLGAGPYEFVKYENKTVYMKANENYYKGAPVTKELQFKVTSGPDKEPGVVQGTIDISDPSASKSALEQIAGENSNGELSGDKLTTVLTDYRGYGYIGMNSENVKVGDDPSSEESKNLRKAIATVISVYRDVVIDSYYGDAASVINYPISNTSWAAPQASDPDYAVAFSQDVNGEAIYTEGMSEDEKYAAALQAALGFFEAAGYTVEDGKLTAAPAGAKLSYEILVGGAGQGDHPSFGILTAASEALGTIGFELNINDLSDSSILWSSTEGGTAELWCAAWSTTIDPDMFQIYHSNGGSAYMYRIYSKDLDEMVTEAAATTDQAVRKALYKECLDFIVDYAVEIPVYQRQDCTIYSTERVNIDTIAKDQTTFYSFMNEIEKVAMN
jgi:peptide/nickel transport system substrate-binding protein